MYRHLSHSAPHKELLLADRSTISSPDNYPETVTNSSTLLRNTREGNTQRDLSSQSVMKSPRSLRRLSWTLHSALVVVHLALIAIWATRLENRVVFALENQNIVSFLVTAITQSFGTIYFAILVLVTQKLSMRRSLITNQPLTATHDSTAAWAGIGSAALCIWHQKVIRASITGIPSVFLYLASILVLHITTPGLLSLETFNSTSLFAVRTEGLPTIANYNINSDDLLPLLSTYASESLYYLPYVDGGTNLGLAGGALYDVPETNAGIGTFTVNATGFNVSCGFFEDLEATFSEDSFQWGLSSGDTTLPAIESTCTICSPGARVSDNPSVPGVISALGVQFFYSTIPIVDSRNNSGGLVNLTPPMNTTVGSIQVFRCSLSLVDQVAVIDGQSKKAITLYPDLDKTTSTWHPVEADVTTGNPLMDNWGLWYISMPPSDFPLNPSRDVTVSVADLYLIQKFNLHSANQSSVPSTLTLHDLENALSELVATMFWTLGHIPPTHQLSASNERVTVENATVTETEPSGFNLVQVDNLIVLFPGENATANEQSTETRLDISTGLVASIVLMLLSLEHLLFRPDEITEQDIPIDGTGLLHVIWLYRSHPELELLLEQVEQPTDDNLRVAGMVRTRLVGSRIAKRESRESF
ncbi:hypothetical protein B0H12DRAFT_1081175 [Mycena haematopus]|nr:hypothetical protein B0H12DRAFT_1081175 [Mycena haematopus]